MKSSQGNGGRMKEGCGDSINGNLFNVSKSKRVLTDYNLAQFFLIVKFFNFSVF